MFLVVGAGVFGDGAVGLVGLLGGHEWGWRVSGDGFGGDGGAWGLGGIGGGIGGGVTMWQELEGRKGGWGVSKHGMESFRGGFR